MNFITKRLNILKNQNLITKTVEKLKITYYKEVLKKLQNNEEVSINIDFSDILGGFIKTISYDKNKNVQVTMVLDIETTKVVLNRFINEKIKKDTILLDFVVIEEQEQNIEQESISNLDVISKPIQN